MLNPLAHDFTPISSFPIEASSTPATKTKKKEHKKKQPEGKPKNKNTPTESGTKSASSLQKNKESRTNNKKDQQHHSYNARTTHSNKGRRKSCQLIQPNLGDMFEKEAKFITIEAAIDPIHRVDTTSLKTTPAHHKSIASEKHVLEHGYERYIDWIDRSLHAFDTVTVVGMENAVVDVVSMVTILQDRKIAAHDDVETFSMNTGHNRISACIQVKLHSYY